MLVEEQVGGQCSVLIGVACGLDQLRQPVPRLSCVPGCACTAAVLQQGAEQRAALHKVHPAAGQQLRKIVCIRISHKHCINLCQAFTSTMTSSGSTMVLCTCF